MMAHQARLKPWIPFYKYTLKNDMPDTALYRNSISDEFPTRVAENLYLKKNYSCVIFDSIITSKPLASNSYKYSDLGFYLIPEMIENIQNCAFEDYVRKAFYRPLGLSTMCYLPRNRFSLDRIVPTENDKAFRKQQLHGDVHDPGAAMLGGVSGHAGLFSDANDLGILCQVLLRNGNYAGRQYFKPETVHDFTQQQFPSMITGAESDLTNLCLNTHKMGLLVKVLRRKAMDIVDLQAPTSGLTLQTALLSCFYPTASFLMRTTRS